MSSAMLPAKRPAAPPRADTHRQAAAGGPGGEHGALIEAVLAHLETQIDSVGRLLEIVLEQGAAIRARKVHAVVRLAGILHGEISRREAIEDQRADLLRRSGDLLGVAPQNVTLTRLCALMDSESAARAKASSARLSGLLRELKREHSCNRALMAIELSFLDHLMRTLALDGSDGYDWQGSSARGSGTRQHGGLHVLDLHA